MEGQSRAEWMHHRFGRTADTQTHEHAHVHAAAAHVTMGDTARIQTHAHMEGQSRAEWMHHRFGRTADTRAHPQRSGVTRGP